MGGPTPCNKPVAGFGRLKAASDPTGREQGEGQNLGSPVTRTAVFQL